MPMLMSKAGRALGKHRVRDALWEEESEVIKVQFSLQRLYLNMEGVEIKLPYAFQDINYKL